MSNVPHTESTLRGNSFEIEELRPGARVLVGSSCNRIAMVKTFREAKEVNKPGSSKDNCWDPVAPAPSSVFGCEATDYGCNMCAVCHACCCKLYKKLYSGSV
jgi:hypothetical protein